MNDSDSGKDRAERKKVFHFVDVAAMLGVIDERRAQASRNIVEVALLSGLDDVKLMLAKVVKS